MSNEETSVCLGSLSSIFQRKAAYIFSWLFGALLPTTSNFPAKKILLVGGLFVVELFVYFSDRQVLGKCGTVRNFHFPYEKWAKNEKSCQISESRN